MNPDQSPQKIIAEYQHTLDEFGKSLNQKMASLQDWNGEGELGAVIPEEDQIGESFFEANQNMKESQHYLLNNYQLFDLDNESLVISIKRLLYVTEELIERSNAFIQDWGNIQIHIGKGKKELDTHQDLIGASLEKIREELNFIKRTVKE